LIPDALKKSRRRSTVTPDLTRLSVSSTSLDVPSLFSQFDISARATIANNLGREKYEATIGLPSILHQVADTLVTTFSSLPNLQTLTLNTQLQSTFIQSLKHGQVLQFSPIFGTFTSISDLITTTILLAYIHSTAPITTLALCAGSPFALTRFLQECSVPVPLETSFITPSPTTLQLPSPFPTLTPHVSTRLSHLLSLTITYDEGHHHSMDDHISHRIARRCHDWTVSVATLLSHTTSLTHLKLCRDQNVFDGKPEYLFRLDTRMLTMSTSTAVRWPSSFRFRLRKLEIGGFVTTFEQLRDFLAAINGTTPSQALATHPHPPPTADSQSNSSRARKVEAEAGAEAEDEAGKGSLNILRFTTALRLETGSWPQIWKWCRDNLLLEEFRMGEGSYAEPSATGPGEREQRGIWRCLPSGCGDGAHRVGKRDGGTESCAGCGVVNTFRRGLCRWVERKQGWVVSEDGNEDEGNWEDEAWWRRNCGGTLRRVRLERM
jgi:hypothetical protein